MPDSPSVFTVAEAATILGMPESRIKNWTNGRPLRIIPSVRPAEGTGSRNLYSKTDLYTFAVANQLKKDGFSLKKIEDALQSCGNRMADGSIQITIWMADWLVIEGSRVYTLYLKVIGPGRRHKKPEVTPQDLSKYYLNVRKLQATIDSYIQTVQIPSVQG
jgi:DNA-binding transcriptional MerR regulator